MSGRSDKQTAMNCGGAARNTPVTHPLLPGMQQVSHPLTSISNVACRQLACQRGTGWQEVTFPTLAICIFWQDFAPFETSGSRISNASKRTDITKPGPPPGDCRRRLASASISNQFSNVTHPIAVHRVSSANCHSTAPPALQGTLGYKWCQALPMIVTQPPNAFLLFAEYLTPPS
ncbi:hypothetical protein C8Q74DRAFT_1439460 [Fomes fomentarius]|nr:hypothetical protein C8Q74DRAFT_1439460 [Fomes fomentarius]